MDFVAALLIAVAAFAIFRFFYKPKRGRFKPKFYRSFKKPASQVRFRPSTVEAAGNASANGSTGDAPSQLRHVMSASFTPRRLMSLREYGVFQAAEQFVQQNYRGFRVMAQTSLGELISSDNDLAYRSINSKRVDLLIIDRTGFPVVAIEYQGEGHHQGNAAARDAVKREALRRAGIGFVEIYSDQTPTDIERILADAMRRTISGRTDAQDSSSTPPVSRIPGPQAL